MASMTIYQISSQISYELLKFKWLWSYATGNPGFLCSQQNDETPSTFLHWTNKIIHNWRSLNGVKKNIS